MQYAQRLVALLNAHNTPIVTASADMYVLTHLTGQQARHGHVLTHSNEVVSFSARVAPWQQHAQLHIVAPQRRAPPPPPPALSILSIVRARRCVVIMQV